MYVGSLLARARVVHNEIPGREEHLAVDLTLTFPALGRARGKAVPV